MVVLEHGIWKPLVLHALSSWQMFSFAAETVWWGMDFRHTDLSVVQDSGGPGVVAPAYPFLDCFELPEKLAG